MGEKRAGHSVAPSVSSAGIAGQGAGSYTYGATGNSAAAAATAASTTSAASAYSDNPADSAAAATAAANAARGLQERPKYVFGQVDGAGGQQGSDDDASEHAHGAYSSEPHVQQAYNPETYGSYAAYDNGAGAGGYQDATREYQGQTGYAQDGQYQGQYQEYAAHGYDQYAQHGYEQQYGQYDAQQYAVADPGQYGGYDQGAYAATGGAPVQQGGAHPAGNAAAYGGM